MKLHMPHRWLKGKNFGELIIIKTETPRELAFNETKFES